MGYPLYLETVPHNPNLLVRERWKLIEFTSELINLLFGTKCFEADKRNLYLEAVALSAKVRQWYDGMPSELRYSTSMPTSVYELQCVSYHGLNTPCHTLVDFLQRPLPLLPNGSKLPGI